MGIDNCMERQESNQLKPRDPVSVTNTKTRKLLCRNLLTVGSHGRQGLKRGREDTVCMRRVCMYAVDSGPCRRAISEMIEIICTR
jgi:hypothetical protein